MQLNYIIPVLNATRFLNKSELAIMAETLVNLVSFRKQVTMEAETVGGPIDVLIITKGDGPIWIKRKHYFTPELNHHFFSNYLKMEKKMEKTQTLKSLKELYGYPETEKKEDDKPKSKYYKLGEQIAKDAIKKVKEKERSRSCFDKWNV
ncbi:MAG: hypothetical protein U5N56_03600 [Candidatus Marinimicrobia bacterium]|nr:hypothetical protein [Candidatus Neomarinimicrobiota bacterium]